MKKILLIPLFIALPLSLSGCNVLRYDSYDDADKYTLIDGSYDFTLEQLDIKKVDFDWGRGSVNVVSTNEGTFSISEESNQSLKDSLKARYYISNKTLFIKYSASKVTYNNKLEKNVTININQTLTSLLEANYSFSLALGNMSISDLKTPSLLASVAYGDMTTSNIDASSGRFICDCGHQSHDNIKLKTLGEMKSNYGNITVKLHESIPGFALNLNCVGGSSSINVTRFPKESDTFYGTHQESDLRLDIIENYGDLRII